MKLNAYMAEMNYWCHADPDYIAFTHNNLNALWTAEKVWSCNGRKMLHISFHEVASRMLVNVYGIIKYNKDK